MITFIFFILQQSIFVSSLSSLVLEKGSLVTWNTFSKKKYAVSNHRWRLFSSNNNFNDPSDNTNSIEYVNGFTKLLSTLLPNRKINTTTTTIINAKLSNKKDNKKVAKLPLPKLAKVLEQSLMEREWFVTGLADPQFFSEDFEFEDPDVKVSGLEEYCKGVQKIFNQEISRAEIILVTVNESTSTSDSTRRIISVLWRLSGGVNLAFGLKIKPFLVRTDFTVSPMSGLITSQRDFFSIPGYDILLSALLPPALWSVSFLAPPAGPAETLRQRYKNGNNLDDLDRLFYIPQSKRK